LALSGHSCLRRTCLLSGAKRTSSFALQMSAYDPKRTSIAPSEALDFIVTMARSSASGVAMRRRDVITLLGGAAAAWPFAARAQQSDRARRIGALIGIEDDATSKAMHEAFRQGLEQLGWTDGRNVRIDARFGAGDPVRTRKYAAELVASSPDVILATGSLATQLVLQETHTVPIIFTIVPDPVGSGFVDSLSQPGGNASGFMQFEYSLSGKWVELLKQMAPNVTRAAVFWDPTIPAGIGQFAVIQSVAPALGVDVRPINVRDASETERAIAAFASQPNGGLIVTAGALTITHSPLINTLAAKHKLPAVAASRFYVTGGILVSYGADFVEQQRRAAAYVDRILKGEKPAGLPVQAPTKYALVVNLKASKTLGIAIPPSVLGRADEVIE
jgi:putative tryptophan/tyrosine transport system substrate-binding protein